MNHDFTIGEGAFDVKQGESKNLEVPCIMESRCVMRLARMNGCPEKQDDPITI